MSDNVIHDWTKLDRTITRCGQARPAPPQPVLIAEHRAALETPVDCPDCLAIKAEEVKRYGAAHREWYDQWDVRLFLRC